MRSTSPISPIATTQKEGNWGFAKRGLQYQINGCLNTPQRTLMKVWLHCNIKTPTEKQTDKHTLSCLYVSRRHDGWGPISLSSWINQAILPFFHSPFVLWKNITAVLPCKKGRCYDASMSVRGVAYMILVHFGDQFFSPFKLFLPCSQEWQ